MFSEVLEDSQVIECVLVCPHKFSRSSLKFGKVRKRSLRFAKIRQGFTKVPNGSARFPTVPSGSLVLFVPLGLLLRSTNVCQGLLRYAVVC